MAQVMFIDTAKYHWFIGIGIAAVFIILGALLLGFLGPSSRDSTVDYAYNCPNQGHVYSPICTGVQLGVRFCKQF